MSKKNLEPPRWFFVPFVPPSRDNFRRWNILLIAILSFIVVGIFLASSFPENAPNAASRISPQGHNVHTP